jgi:hypothetical protein
LFLDLHVSRLSTFFASTGRKGALDASLVFTELKGNSHIDDCARADRDPDFLSRVWEGLGGI